MTNNVSFVLFSALEGIWISECCVHKMYDAYSTVFMHIQYACIHPSIYPSAFGTGLECKKKTSLQIFMVFIILKMTTQEEKSWFLFYKAHLEST